MPQTTPIAGFGARFYYGLTTASYTSLATGWTQVTNVIGYKPPEDKVKEIPTMAFDSTTNVMTYLGGNVDPGDCELTLQYDKSIFAALRAMRGVGKNFRILFSDNSGVGFSGFISGAPTQVDLDGLVGMSIKIKVSGDHVAISAAT